MDTTARPDPDILTSYRPDQDLSVRAAGAWVHQLGRTLKTCRLYDAKNPTVVRFRADCAAALERLLLEQGAMTFKFTSDDVLLGEESLYAAKSRDDNLALPFHRDGIRALTLTPGIEAREVDVLLDGLLLVSGQNAGHDDLVTLLWEAHLPHIEIDYVPGESDFGGGAAEQGEEPDGVPWPTGVAEEAEPDARVTVTDETTEETEDERKGRSDDWATGELTVEIEAGFEELEALAPSETKRFRQEYDAEHAVPPVTTALAIMRAALASGANDDDRAEFGRFVPRLLRLSVSRGAWLEAREALAIVQSCRPTEWSTETFAQELMQPISVSTTVEFLDNQPMAGLVEFIGFAKTIGEPAVDWLNQLLAESQQRRVRRTLAESVAELCQSNPERLAPWLSDRRWYVVRNIVHILGWIGGPTIVPLLQAPSRHPEARVRQEVVTSLARVEPRLARPLLLRLLEGADTRMFGSILHLLGGERNPTTARMLLAMMQEPEFDQRPLEERRAIYIALSGSGSDETVPDLEAELMRGNWFSRNLETHRQSVARCLARIGTPSARQALERGLLSRRPPVRKACEDALSGIIDRD